MLLSVSLSKQKGLKIHVNSVHIHILPSVLELHGPKVKHASSLYLGSTFEILVQTFLKAMLSIDTCLNLDCEL